MNVIMVKQYRITLDDITLEIPAGKFDKGDTPKECAIRELAEETGYKADTIEHIFAPMVSCGFTTEKIHIFLCNRTDFR